MREILFDFFDPVENVWKIPKLLIRYLVFRKPAFSFHILNKKQLKRVIYMITLDFPFELFFVVIEDHAMGRTMNNSEIFLRGIVGDWAEG